MEGSIVNLPKIIELKKKYKAYLYLDEAHSIGALGKSGRGVTDYWNVRPDEIDVLMGTFTKRCLFQIKSKFLFPIFNIVNIFYLSFGSCGGYIAGSRRLVNYIRINSHAHCYASSMSAPIAQQIISSLKILTNKNDLDDDNKGEKRINQLAWNSNYFREKLKKMGFIVYGSNDSPIVPLMM
jgi:serine palmitoyltransferase